MDNEQYDAHLQNFYTETFKMTVAYNAFRNTGGFNPPNETTKIVDEAFKEYSTVYNERFANEFLNKLAEQNPTIKAKIENYPSMYWKTSGGEYDLHNASMNSVVVSKMYNAAISNGMLTNEMLTNAFAETVETAKSMSKVSPEKASKVVSNFHGHFLAYFDKNRNPIAPVAESPTLYSDMLKGVADQIEDTSKTQQLSKAGEAILCGLSSCISANKTQPINLQDTPPRLGKNIKTI